MKLKNGFTLVELLVSIMIIGVISGLIFANYRGGSKEGNLLRSAQKLAQDLRRVQNMATSTIAINGEIREYYGVNLRTAPPDNTKYILFIDLNENQVYNPPEFIETISLESNVQIYSFTPSAPTTKNIVFRAPFGETTLTSNLTITLSLIDNIAKQKSVIIKPSGQIEIQ